MAPSGHVLVSDNGNNLIREITGTAPPTPTVNAVKPVSGPTTGDHKVTITGINLSGTTAVMFGSRPALSFTVRSNKKIIAFSPTSTVGRVIVRVYSAAGVSVANAVVDSYTYLTQSVRQHARRR